MARFIIALLFAFVVPAISKPIPAAHPGSGDWLGKTVPETGVHSVDGKVVSTIKGQMACEYGGVQAPIFLRASWTGKVKLETPRANGAASVDVTWIGWNNLVTKVVDRYLITKEVDKSGNTIKEQCTTYPDVDPKGYSDPLPLMAERYKLVNATDDSNEYLYQWKLQNGAQMSSTEMSEPKGFPPQSIDVTSITTDGHKSEYKFEYTAPSNEVDSSIFYEYKKHNCVKASNFTSPDICVNSWLVLQYECAFIEGVNPEITV